MSNYSLSAANAILKEMYAAGVKDLTWKNHLLPGLVRKSDIGGKGKQYPVTIGHGAGGSMTFTSAQTYRSSPTDVSFDVGSSTDPLKQMYVTKGIAGRAFRGMLGGGKKAFMDGLDRITDAAMGLYMDRLAWQMYGNRSGSLGLVTYVANASSFTLQTPQNHVRFYKDQPLTYTQSSETGALGTGGDTLKYVVSVTGRGTSTVTISLATSVGGSASDIDDVWTQFATNSYVFTNGDHVSSADNLCLSGLNGWLPSSAPGATAWFGVARNVEAELLGGVRYDASGLSSLEQGLVQACANANGATGAPVDHIIMHPDQFAKLVVELSAKNRYPIENAARAVSEKGRLISKFGYSGIMLDANHGQVKVLSDRFCDVNSAFGLTLNSWELASAGPFAFVDDDDDQGPISRVYNADAYELRCKGYLEMVCDAPGHNINITLPSL